MVTAGGVLNRRYQLGRQIGQGGFARVFLGVDLRLKRQVAIKILNSEIIETAEGLARFEREAQVVAALEHPNILAVYDYGEAEGTVFLVMPYIAGGALYDRLRGGKRLDLHEAGTYLRQASVALDYAHRHNLVHRDIKPQNMLLRGEDGRLLLTDFGIAKVLSTSSAHSRTGVVGTLSYMAPEQLRGEVGRAIDIYALGCVLFQMLTGRTPYAGPTEQVVMGHLTQPIPSIVEYGEGRLPAALQGIIDRALAKEAAERFPSAGELAKAYDTVVSPMSPDGMVVGGSTPPASFALPPLPRFDSASAGFAPVAEPPTRVAPKVSVRPPQATEAAGALVQPPAEPLPGPAEVVRPPTPLLAPSPESRPGRKRAFAGLATVITGLLIAVMVVGVLIVGRQQGSSPGTTPPANSAGSTGTETIFSGHTGVVRAVAWAPGGGVLASASDDRTMRLWSADGKELAVLSGHDGFITAVAWSPDGKTLASSSKDQTVRLWSVDGKQLAVLSGHSDKVSGVVWAPDGSTVASASDDQTVRLWAIDGKALATLPGHVTAWSPDGRMLASADNTYVYLWRANGTPLATLAGHTSYITSVAWSPDGATLASGGDDNTVRLWDAGGRALATLAGHTKTIWTVAWSPDGATLASSASDKTVRLWDPSGKELTTLPGHVMAWNPDGKRLALGTDDNKVLLRQR